MNSLFDLIGSKHKTIPPGILVTAMFREGSHGVIEIYRHQGLDLYGRGTNRADFETRDSLRWSGLFEELDYPNKDRDPSNRGHSTRYLAYGLDGLDTIVTSNGGRFLSVKQVWNGDMLRGSIDKEETYQREVGVQFDGNPVQEILQYLGQLLSRLGVPQTDTGRVIEDALTKLGYSTSEITDFS